MKGFWKICIASIIATSCNTGEDTHKKSADTVGRLDSMPIIAPPIHDSEAVLNTPPVNDNNVIIPDTTKRKD